MFVCDLLTWELSAITPIFTLGLLSLPQLASLLFIPLVPPSLFHFLHAFPLMLPFYQGPLWTTYLKLQLHLRTLNPFPALFFSTTLSLPDILYNLMFWGFFCQLSSEYNIHIQKDSCLLIVSSAPITRGLACSRHSKIFAEQMVGWIIGGYMMYVCIIDG